MAVTEGPDVEIRVFILKLAADLTGAGHLAFVVILCFHLKYFFKSSSSGYIHALSVFRYYEPLCMQGWGIQVFRVLQQHQLCLL